MKVPTLASITILPPPGETGTDAGIIEDWAQGLDWVRWLLGSVRARLDELTVRVEGAAFEKAWADFSTGVVFDSLGLALMDGWQAVVKGDMQALLRVDERLSSELTPELAECSVKAGALLLKSTRHARYQGLLGRLREAVAQGRGEGHFLVAWAAVGHFFQLPLTSVIAEYVRLEWDIASRKAEFMDASGVRNEVAMLTGRVMRSAQGGRVPGLVRA